MRIDWEIVFSVVIAQVQGTYTRAKETRRCWRHPSGMAPVVSSSLDEREMLKGCSGCSRQDVTVPAPVGASHSLRGEGEVPRFTFVPTASNACCEPGYGLQGLHDADK